jgi:hypothetical protein
MNEFYSQKSNEWKSVSRYHQPSADSLGELDEAIQDCIRDINNPELKATARKALQDFSSSIDDLIDNGMNAKGDCSGYSILDYGCWDCTIAMLISDFGEKIYASESSSGTEPNPRNLVECLRSWQVLSPIAYSHDIVNDPISIITKSKIQMYLHEDYGGSGVAIKDATVFNYALESKRKVGIAACVKGHPSFGKRNTSHWIYIEPGSSKGNIIMRDPSRLSPEKFSYRKIYEVSVYTTSNEFRNIFDN